MRPYQRRNHRISGTCLNWPYTASSVISSRSGTSTRRYTPARASSGTRYSPYTMLPADMFRMLRLRRVHVSVTPIVSNAQGFRASTSPDGPMRRFSGYVSTTFGS